MRIRTLISAVFFLSLVLSGCGSDPVSQRSPDATLYTVEPDRHSLLLADDSGETSAVVVQLPEGPTVLRATFDGAHAGGDLDGVLLLVQTDETTSTWPRGHAFTRVIREDPVTLHLVKPRPGYLFFVDRASLTDNRGEATVYVNDVAYTVDPAANTVMMPMGSDSQIPVALAAGTYRFESRFEGAHAGGDLDSVLMLLQTDEQTAEWPAGHAIYATIGQRAIALTLPKSATVSLFFVDLRVKGDNQGQAVVAIRPL